jgi:TonB family protein
MQTVAKLPSNDALRPNATPAQQASLQQHHKAAAQQDNRQERETVEVSGKRHTSTPLASKEEPPRPAEVFTPRSAIATGLVKGGATPRESAARRAPLAPVIPPPLSIGNTAEQKNLTASILHAPVTVPRLSLPERRLRVSEGVIRGRAVSRPLPAYPEMALKSGVHGSVILQGIIAVDGTVKNLHVVEGDPLLAQSALDTARKWRYDTSYLNRVPIEIATIDEMKFSIGSKAEVSAPLRISEGVLRGRAITQPGPSYPELARRLGVEGSVVLRGVIAVDGTVKSLRVVQGHPLLAQSTLDAVRNWRFETSYLNRVPVEVETVFVVQFRRHR